MRVFEPAVDVLSRSVWSDSVIRCCYVHMTSGHTVLLFYVFIRAHWCHVWLCGEHCASLLCVHQGTVVPCLAVWQTLCFSSMCSSGHIGAMSGCVANTVLLFYVFIRAHWCHGWLCGKHCASLLCVHQGTLVPWLAVA